MNGGCVIVILTSAYEAVHGALEIVHRNTTGPTPLVWVKVAPGVAASGLNVPVPPLTTDHAPVPTLGVLPPRPDVVPSAHMVCGPPTVAVVGGWFTVIVCNDASSTEQGPLVANTLKVVVAVNVPVGRLIVEPVPVTGLPTFVLPESFRSW
jgi:hypothetical protein